jgi:hypothetical protein
MKSTEKTKLANKRAAADIRESFRLCDEAKARRQVRWLLTCRDPEAAIRAWDIDVKTHLLLWLQTWYGSPEEKANLQRLLTAQLRPVRTSRKASVRPQADDRPQNRATAPGRHSSVRLSL